MKPDPQFQLPPKASGNRPEGFRIEVSRPRSRPVVLDPHCTKMDLRDQIEVWVNEGGAGGEAPR